MSFAGWASEGLRPNRFYEIDQPPSRRDFASRRLRRKFRSGSGLLSSIDSRFRFPQRQHEHGDLAGGGDGGLAEPAPPARSNGPGFQRREPFHLADHAGRRLEQQPAHCTVAAFRHATRPIHFAGLVSLRCEPEKRAHIRRSAEPVRIIDQGDEAERFDWANTGNGHQAARDRMSLGFLLHTHDRGHQPPDTAWHGRR